jgi:hypothetical protein
MRKILPQNADFSGLTNAERRILNKCAGTTCVHDMETCPCNNRKSSSKYCDNYSQMVKVYDKIRQPDLFTSIENVA